MIDPIDLQLSLEDMSDDELRQINGMAVSILRERARRKAVEAQLKFKKGDKVRIECSSPVWNGVVGEIEAFMPKNVRVKIDAARTVKVPASMLRAA